MNVLDEIAWVKTTQGKRTVRDCFIDPTIELSTDVFGYEYGATFRFLMTILPLLVREEPSKAKSGKFSEAIVDKVFSLLRSHANLFDVEKPFLQVTSADVNNVAFADPSPVSKLIPHTQAPDDAQSEYWNFSRVKSSYTINEAVLLLLSYYFYGPGTNTKLLKPKDDDHKLNNGASALQYTGDGGPATEVIPQGESLLDSLRMSTPKSWVTSDVLPHWADKVSRTNNVIAPNWRFSWSSNTVFLTWENEELVGVTRGRAPFAWLQTIPTLPGEKWPKSFHDTRLTLDPLYPYKQNKDGELKLHRISLGSDPVYSIAEWHANRITQLLASKWEGNLLKRDSLKNLIFLEHKTGGTAQSFAIRHSVVIEGYKEELFPENEEIKQQVFDRFHDSNMIRKRLLGMFTENGTMKHIAQQQADAEVAFWNELHELTLEVITRPITVEEWRKELIKATLRAFETVSTSRNTVHIKAHLAGIRNIRGVFK